MSCGGEGEWNRADFRSTLIQMMTAVPRLSLTIDPFHRQFSPHSHKMAAEIPFLTFYQNLGKRETHCL